MNDPQDESTAFGSLDAKTQSLVRTQAHVMAVNNNRPFDAEFCDTAERVLALKIKQDSGFLQQLQRMGQEQQDLLALMPKQAKGRATSV